MISRAGNPFNKMQGITSFDVIRVLRPVEGSEFRDRMTVGDYIRVHPDKQLASNEIRSAIQSRHIRIEHREPPALEHLNRDMEAAINALPAARPGRV